MRSLIFVAFASTATYAEPDGSKSGQCVVKAELQPVVGATSVTMKVVLKNTSPSSVTLDLNAKCGARFMVRGEPANTCPPSPCRAAPAQTVTIGAKKSLTLGTVKIVAKGSNCRPSMPDGMTSFQAAVFSESTDVCSGAAVDIWKDAKTGKLSKTKPSTKPSKPKKPCPACGIGCPNGMPSSKVDANGCSVCACEDFGPPH